MEASGSTNSRPPVQGKLQESDTTTARLLLRLLRLAWLYKGRTLRVLFVQALLVGMMLGGLGLVGLGLDVLKYDVDQRAGLPEEDIKAPQWPFELSPPAEWSTMSVIGLLGLAIFLIASVRFVLERLNTIAKHQLVQDIVVDLRTKVYDKLQRLSFGFFDANESGSIINRVAGDVQQVRRFIDGVMLQVMVVLISLAFYLVYMLSIHVWLTLACLATTPLLWFLSVWFSRVVRPAYRKNRELFDQTVRVLSEDVQAMHVVKGFCRQDEEIERFRRANDAVRKQKRWIFWRVTIFTPLISFIPHLNILILLGVGGYIYAVNPTFTIGYLVVFARLLQQFSTQIGNIAQIANAMQQSLVGAQRVFEVLDAPVEIESPAEPAPLQRAEGHVAFEDVGFMYPGNDEQTLEQIRFDVQPGECVAILGATGAGKTTLLNLIPRFYDPTHGRVRIDGRDIRDYDIHDLRRNVGFVFQENFLFSTTVAENIAFGHPHATREQVEKAARIAAAHDFIMEDLPDGYETILGERGSNLSGGQQQRLAIARAVLLEPPILVLDDPTAAIDPETEHEILVAMDRAMRGRTTFVVAHRLSTLRRSDKVVVLDHGRIVQVGTHEELIQKRGHYRKAARLQIADEESKRLLGIDQGGARA